MSVKRTCPDCGGDLQLVDRQRRVFQPNPETMTDGQLAEQYAVQMGGAFEEGIHGVITRVFECSECGETVDD